MADSRSYSPILTQQELHSAISALGKVKAEKSALDQFILGTLAGLYISLGGHLFLAALASGANKVTAAAAFAVGLVLVVIAGAELFTGNIIMVVGTISRIVRFRRLFKNWGLVYLGNFVGSMTYAAAAWGTGLFGDAGAPNALGELAISVAAAKMALPFAQAFLRGFFANVLVILAIIMSITAKEVMSKVIVIVLPIMAFVAMGFEHSIANMFLIPVGLFAGGAPASDFVAMWGNIGPVTLGNIAGGIFILLIHPNRVKQIRDLLARRRRR
jgi:formate/nitrite transporter